MTETNRERRAVYNGLSDHYHTLMPWEAEWRDGLDRAGFKDVEFRADQRVTPSEPLEGQDLVLARRPQ